MTGNDTVRRPLHIIFNETHATETISTIALKLVFVSSYWTPIGSYEPVGLSGESCQMFSWSAS